MVCIRLFLTEMRRHTYPHKLFRFILLKSKGSKFHPVEPMHFTASKFIVKFIFSFLSKPPKAESQNQPARPNHNPASSRSFQPTLKSRPLYNTFSFCQKFFFETRGSKPPHRASQNKPNTIVKQSLHLERHSLNAIKPAAKSRAFYRI